MLALCVQYQVPVIVSSDAHDPSAVGDVDLARQLMESISFPEALVLNTDARRTLDFLLSRT